MRWTAGACGSGIFGKKSPIEHRPRIDNRVEKDRRSTHSEMGRQKNKTPTFFKAGVP